MDFLENPGPLARHIAGALAVICSVLVIASAMGWL